MENRICIDTNVLVDFLRKKPDAVEWVNAHEQNTLLATTTINIFELFYGAYKSTAQKTNIQAVEQLIQKLIILNLSPDSARYAGALLAALEKDGHPIEFRDLFIGSITVGENFALKTKNIKHFSRFKELVLV